MKLFERLFGGEKEKNLMQLVIMMNYSVKTGRGVAAVKWDDSFSGGEAIKAQLISLLYGRILCVHRETRQELFDRVDEISKMNVRTEGAAGFHFTDWILDVDDDKNYIWPWEMQWSEPVLEGYRFTATLKYGKKSNLHPLGRWIHLDMTSGLERVLCPASVLIVINDFNTKCDQEAKYFLALLLWQMNKYWGSADNIQVNTEACANAAAEHAIRSGNLQEPD